MTSPPAVFAKENNVDSTMVTKKEVRFQPFRECADVDLAPIKRS